jgi:hypothetical protein
MMDDVLAVDRGSSSPGTLAVQLVCVPVRHASGQTASLNKQPKNKLAIAFAESCRAG